MLVDLLGGQIDIETWFAPEYAVSFFASPSEKYGRLAKLARPTPQ